MDPRFEQVDALFASFDKTNSPGCTIAVIQNSQILYSRGYGIANLEHSIPNQPHTRFYLASMSKQFTAFCIALLEEEGKIHLNENIRKYIPEIPQYQAPITIQHLVHHTSGLRDYLELYSMSGQTYDEILVEEEALEMISRQKELNFNPGDEFLYSNSGYILLAMIVARVSGKTFRQFADENIFRPLGMSHTHVQDNHQELVPLRATAYAQTANGYQIAVPNFDMVGDGGIYSNVEDLFLWDQNFYHNQLGCGQPNLIDRILSLQNLNNGEINHYAFGLMVNEYKGLKEISHSGGYGGYHTEMIRYPEQNFSVAILGNHGSISSTSTAHKIAEVFLMDEMTQPEIIESKETFISLPEKELKEKTGLYFCRQDGLPLEICVEDGTSTMVINGMSIPIKPKSKDIFLSDGGPIPVMLEFQTQSLKMILSPKNQVIFERVNAIDLTDEEKAEIQGNYFSEELQTSCKIYLDEKKLVYKIRNDKQILKPGEKDMYFYSQGTILVERLDGNVTGFLIQTERVRNIRFERK